MHDTGIVMFFPAASDLIAGPDQSVMSCLSAAAERESKEQS